MEEQLDFKKIRYIQEFVNVEDFSINRTVYEVNPNGTIKVSEYLCKNLFSKKEKSTKQLISQGSLLILDRSLISDFVSEVLELLSKPKTYCDIIDDCEEKLEISFNNDYLKIIVDRSVGDGEKCISSLFCDLMKKAICVGE